MSEPTTEQLKAFYDWMRSQVEGSYQHYNQGGQHVNRNFWLPPSVRFAIERQMRDMELIDKSNDFPWTYCKLCGNHYPYSMSRIDDTPLCGSCFLEFRDKKT